MYKIAKPDGYDFYSQTINYRENIGKTVRLKDFNLPDIGVYGRSLHASKNPNDCFVGADIPCSAFKVKGIQKIAGDERILRYQALKVLEEIEDLDKLFGWNYSEAINPVNPFRIKPPKITDEHIELLKEWISIENSIRDSIGGSIRSLIGGSAWYSIWNFIWNSTRISIDNSVDAYMGSLFPNIKKWEGVDHEEGVYPFQSGADLWRMGLVPSFGRGKWRLLGGSKGEILFEL